MSRASRREIKKHFRKISLNFKVQKHFLPDLIKELSVRDPRHTSYTDYDIEEILYTVIMKCMYHIFYAGYD